MATRHLFTSSAGVKHYIEDDSEHEAGKFRIHSQFPYDSQLLERNKAMANHNDGYTPSRDIRRVASVPLTMLYRWLVEEGFDPRYPGSHTEAMEKITKKKLNDPDYRYLRTAPGRL